jgi:hypothetical protein
MVEGDLLLNACYFPQVNNMCNIFHFQDYKVMYKYCHYQYSRIYLEMKIVCLLFPVRKKLLFVFPLTVREKNIRNYRKAI